MITLLDADQREIRDVARRFLGDSYPPERVLEIMESDAGFEQGAWDELIGLGWAGVGLSEDLGGAGYGDVERGLLLEEMGRVCAPVPFLSTAVLARDLLTAAGGTPEAQELLGRVAVGEVRAAAVVAGDLHAGPSVAGGVRAANGSDGPALAGPGGVTLEAGSAEVLVVVAALVDGGVGVFEVDPDGPGVTRTPHPMIDATRRFAAVTFDGAPARRLDIGTDVEGAVRRGLDRATVGLAAEMIGGAQRCVDLTTEYALQRHQFGVPIGSFQAIKHRLADLLVGVDAARELVLQGAELATAGAAEDTIATAAAAAKAAVSDVYETVTGEAIQLHGAIGFTWEHAAHLYFKRARVSAALLGRARDHRAILGWAQHP